MPRLGLHVSDSFVSHSSAKDPYGRRVRHVEGVRVVGEQNFSSLLLKATLTLASIATASGSIAAWRLFGLAH